MVQWDYSHQLQWTSYYAFKQHFGNVSVWWWWLFDRALLHLSPRNKLLNKSTREYAFLALLKLSWGKRHLFFIKKQTSEVIGVIKWSLPITLDPGNNCLKILYGICSQDSDNAVMWIDVFKLLFHPDKSGLAKEINLFSILFCFPDDWEQARHNPHKTEHLG